MGDPRAAVGAGRPRDGGFGWAAYTANTLAFPADVVPRRATATVWGLASVGAGLGGAFFQQAFRLPVEVAIGVQSTRK